MTCGQRTDKNKTSLQKLQILITVIMEQLVVSEDTTLPLCIDGFEVKVKAEGYGIHELTQDIYSGVVRIGRLRALIVLLRCADMLRGCHLAGVLEIYSGSQHVSVPALPVCDDGTVSFLQ